MATTTTNFGWDIPQSTDLVKDGATAIAALGQDIDTALVDLKGGTTGQILAKASNTDLDYSWITNDVGDITAVTAGTGISGGGTSGAVTITNSMATEIAAKGDLIVGTGAATFDNLTAGANGDTLVADSSTTTGLRYQPARTQQLFLNSAFDVWQRGTSGADYPTGSGYVADRWQGIRGGAVAGMTMSRQAAQNTALPNVQYAMRMQRNSGNTSTQDIRIFYSAETADSIPFAGQVITFSYYVRKGANYSGGDVTGTIYSGTGTDQNLGISGFTGTTGVIAVTRTSATLTTDWTRVQGTATVAATATQLGLLLAYTPTGTAGANDWIEITGIQLEVGAIATPFKRSSGTIQGELAACQRYYWRSETSLPRIPIASTTTSTTFGGTNPTTMRVAPSLSSTFTNANYGTVWSVSQPGIAAATKSGTVAITYSAQSNIFWNIYFYNQTWSVVPTALEIASSAGYIEASAEL